MKSAMPMDSGTAIRSASAAAHTVPNTRGATYDQKFSAPFRSAAPRVRAGSDCATRKTATAARMTRMMLPAATVAPEKMRSPGRCLARILGAAVAVTGGLLGVGETGLGRLTGWRHAPSGRPARGDYLTVARA